MRASRRWSSAQHIPSSVVRPLVEQREQTRDSINAYDGELRYQDAQLAQLLAALAARPDWGRTAVVIVGDHGEGLGQHGEAAHGGTWDEQLHAPLLMRIPGETPRRVASLITAADLIPTLLGRLDVPALAPLLAQSSGRDVLKENLPPRAVVSQETGRLRGADEFRYALTEDRWKLVYIERKGGAGQSLLFDLEADPFELADVSAREPQRDRTAHGGAEAPARRAAPSGREPARRRAARDHAAKSRDARAAARARLRRRRRARALITLPGSRAPAAGGARRR